MANYYLNNSTFGIFKIMSRKNFMLRCAENDKNFIILRPCDKVKFNSLPVGGYFCRLLIIFATSLNSD